MIIVIDPGHGGHDPGGYADEYSESHLVLGYALELAAQLRSRGFEVYMTREADVFVPLKTRSAFANVRDADLFISVHANASVNSSAKGCQVFYAKGSEKGRRIAKILQQALQPVLGGSFNHFFDDESDHTNGPLSVLRRTKMSAVLIELGFLTNKEDASRLATRATHYAACRAIVDALSVEYKVADVVDEPKQPPVGNLNLDFIQIPTPEHIDEIARVRGLKREELTQGVRVVERMLRGMQWAGVKWAKPLADVLSAWLLRQN